MKYLIWYNKVASKYNYGTQDKYITMKQFYGEKILLDEEFENISEDIIKKVTKSINKQYKKTAVFA